MSKIILFLSFLSEFLKCRLCHHLAPSTLGGVLLGSKITCVPDTSLRTLVSLYKGL